MAELHIVYVAEASPRFAQMLRLACWSVRRRGGRAASVPITVVFNERGDDALSAELERDFGVKSIVRPRISTALRFTNKWNCLEAELGGGAGEATPWMLFLDCDTAIVNPLDPLMDRLAVASEKFFCSPEHTRQAWGLRRILKRHTGRSDAELDAIAHDWFPSDRLPIFNTGVFAIRREVMAGFRGEIVAMCNRLHSSMRATTWNPVQFALVQWNRRHWKKPDAAKWLVGPFFPRVHSGQLAVPATLLKLGIPFGLLPHADNWRDPIILMGESEPIRVLHYLGSRFPIDRSDLFNGSYFEKFAKSENPGWRALVEVVSAYNAERGTGPVWRGGG
ncbi:MAG: hypothetical protein ACKVZJ_01355 [Phycisphaerales bacterium]